MFLSLFDMFDEPFRCDVFWDKTKETEQNKL